MAKKTVSVVLCTHNGERYLREQLESVVNQTYPIAELIIQDDNSSDATMRIVEEYAQKYPFVSYKINRPSLGVNQNFLTALRSAKGDFVAICDQDDVWELNKLERQMAEIGDHLMCSSHTKPFSDDGSFAYYDARRPNISLVRLLFASLPGHSMLVNRKLISMLPHEKSITDVLMYDTMLCVTAAAYDSIVYLDDILVHQRRHSDAVTYTDFARSLPSASNGLYILRWSIRHYREAKPAMKQLLSARKALLEGLDCDTEVCKEALKIIDAELTDGSFAYLKLTYLFMKNHKRLFHTAGGGTIKLCRAALYPIMQMFNYRLCLKK